MMSLALAVVMCLSLCVPALASESAASALFELDRESTDLATYQTAMAAYVESQHDEIQAEIEEYQASVFTTYAYTYGGFTYLTGDIIVTDDTSSSGILEHAGIVVESTSSGCKVLEITPNLYNGGNKHPTAVSISTWFSEYDSAYVLRDDLSTAMSAAAYGKSYFLNGSGKNMTYSIVSANLYGTDNTYCSALVWRCFYNGAGVKYEVLTGNQVEIWYVPTYFLPYDFITYRAHNGLTAVHSVNM